MLRVVMLLAHSDDEPQGNTRDGYEITLALTPDGRLDAGAQGEAAGGWRVRRFAPGDAGRCGALVHLGEDWAIRYENRELETLTGDIAHRVFRPGEYVTLHPEGGAERVYRIVEVARDAAGPPSLRAGEEGRPGA